jgi:hypothetical protein
MELKRSEHIKLWCVTTRQLRLNFVVNNFPDHGLRNPPIKDQENQGAKKGLNRD